jgi:cell wall-associated NlpC family hydrolase
MPQLNGKALAAVAVGTVFVWSGIKGWSVLATIGDIIGGVKPTGTATIPLTVTSGEETSDSGASSSFGGGTITGSGNGAAIAAEGVKWVGHPYRYAGAPGMDGKGYWDCSSFCNFIYAIKFGLPIPGYGPGKWNGSNHGPPTMSWAVWTGVKNVPRDQVQAGDVILWVGHMGIAISNTHMVHAPNPKRGTVIDRIEVEGKPIRTARYI